ncbi:MAG: hypothetical protein ABI401_03600 [Candidatus Dormibacter sp.]
MDGLLDGGPRFLNGVAKVAARNIKAEVGRHIDANDVRCISDYRRGAVGMLIDPTCNASPIW